MTILAPEQFNGRKIVQIAFNVNNLERAALHWIHRFGAGPFFIYDQIAGTDVRAPDGSPGIFELGAAFGQWGPVMVELVKIHRVEPDASASVLLRQGFHHIAYFASDTEAEVAELERNGAPVLTSLSFGTARVHFHDGLATSGFIIEHYPCIDAIEELYRKVAEAAAGWDSSQPLRGPVS